MSLDLRIINNIGGFILDVSWTIDNELLVRFPHVTLEKNMFFGTGGAYQQGSAKKAIEMMELF